MLTSRSVDGAAAASQKCKLACASILEWFRMQANKSSACSQVADQCSKVEDNSEWVLHEEVFQEFNLGPRAPGSQACTGCLC
jgi:hypothetical protein